MLWNIITWLVVGALVGWIASKIFKTKLKLIGYIIVGIIGSLLGGFLFGLVGLGDGGFLWSLVTSVVGALLVLFIYSKIKK